LPVVEETPHTILPRKDSVACGALGMPVNGEPRAWPPAAGNMHVGLATQLVAKLLPKPIDGLRTRVL